MPSRRTLVAGLCLFPLTGCLGTDDPGTNDSSTRASDGNGGSDRQTDSTDETDFTDEMPTYEVLEEASEPGRAEPIAAREAEWDRWVEYVPEDDEVRYVASKGPSDSVDPEDYDQEPPERDLTFTTTEWDSWKHVRATEIAGKAAAETVGAELDRDDIDRPFSGPADGPATLRIETIVDGDDEPVRGGEIDLDEFAAATPEAVEVTYELDGQVFETTRPITATYRKTRSA